MLEIKKLKHLSQRHVKLFDTGVNAAEKRNYQYAIDIFRNLLKQEPGVLEVRKKLREIELERFGGEINAIRQILGSIVTLPNQIKSLKLVTKGKFSEAFDNAEGALKFDPTSIKSCLLLARVSDAANLPAVTIQTIEMALEHNPDSIPLLTCLADAYANAGFGKKSVECYTKITRLEPKNDKYKEALTQMTSDAAADDTDPEVLFYYGDNATEPKKNRSTDKQALETQIKVQLNTLKKMDTTEIRKKLGDLYTLAKEYEKAIENYEKAIELSTLVDPDLDHAFNEVTSLQFDASIAEWTAYIQNQQISEEEREEGHREIERLREKKSKILIDRMKERYRRNPHSQDICFELAKLLWKSELFDEAITYFNRTESSAQFKEQSLLFLGKCYYSTRQYNQAIEQLKKLLDSSKRMNEVKKNAYYSLAKCYEAQGNVKEADNCYKSIYSVDEDYRDVSQIIDKVYQRESMEKHL